MHHADSAIQQALIVLGQAVNPVLVVGPEEIHEIYARAGIGDPTAGLNAFRSPDDMTDPNIYVNRDSAVYMNAVRKPSALTALKLAATLAHEQVHNSDGDAAAYRLQSDFVRDKLRGLPWHQQEGARRYLEELDARARALARAERLRPQSPGRTAGRWRYLAPFSLLELGVLRLGLLEDRDIGVGSPPEVEEFAVRRVRLYFVPRERIGTRQSQPR